MNSILLAIIAVFIILILYDMRIFIRNKEPAKVYVLYFFLMGAGLIVSLLLAAGIRPVAPSRLIEAVFKMIGIAK
ncbi:MAG TPA: hypothetical protein PK767_08510 [Clostridiales bacterium]|nr:hypothetical protein [Clostridiaceae bacterium]NLW03602.1 hypothetical protein [Clostridiaceae bacterium]HOK43929.1 hypothetical protein [Thermoclostridium caenicola]HOQ76358.1 hypothetical protein [Thermoclostridium sp.]HPP36267.1 hypothetical protein [Clostridiales bacterium]